MKFGQKVSIRKQSTTAEYARGIWNPGMVEWRDIVEDYLYISKKRIHNKLSLFKLQLNILQDIVMDNSAVEGYKKLQAESKDNKINGKITKKQHTEDMKHFNSEIISNKMINKALREIADGIVWKYFNTTGQYFICLLISNRLK